MLRPSLLTDWPTSDQIDAGPEVAPGPLGRRDLALLVDGALADPAFIGVDWGVSSS